LLASGKNVPDVTTFPDGPRGVQQAGLRGAHRLRQSCRFTGSVQPSYYSGGIPALSKALKLVGRCQYAALAGKTLKYPQPVFIEVLCFVDEYKWKTGRNPSCNPHVGQQGPSDRARTVEFVEAGGPHRNVGPAANKATAACCQSTREDVERLALKTPAKRPMAVEAQLQPPPSAVHEGQGQDTVLFAKNSAVNQFEGLTHDIMGLSRPGRPLEIT
jgi:hypothetical protein